ncbi:hypothetical protein NH340_JMT01668 [Sarcoptes scabiei]|nr:hypothetical protein NH340_JMT01668 [Sarcoptes scabiei]
MNFKNIDDHSTNTTTMIDCQRTLGDVKVNQQEQKFAYMNHLLQMNPLMFESITSSLSSGSFPFLNDIIKSNVPTSSSQVTGSLPSMASKSFELEHQPTIAESFFQQQLHNYHQQLAKMHLHNRIMHSPESNSFNMSQFNTQSNLFSHQRFHSRQTDHSDLISNLPAIHNSHKSEKNSVNQHPCNRFGQFNSSDDPKPQQSYIGLIAMAILSMPDQKMVLSDIYQYIMDNYPYFRNRGPGWRNSIRHNLSLNDCFVKSTRSPNGKGHYWAIHPANLEDFKKGDFRRRKAQRKVRKHMGLSVPDDEDDDEDDDENDNEGSLPSSIKFFHKSQYPIHFQSNGSPMFNHQGLLSKFSQPIFDPTNLIFTQNALKIFNSLKLGLHNKQNENSTTNQINQINSFPETFYRQFFGLDSVPQSQWKQQSDLMSNRSNQNRTIRSQFSIESLLHNNQPRNEETITNYKRPRFDSSFNQENRSTENHSKISAIESEESLSSNSSLAEDKINENH